jgi:hypothetical protein
MDDSSRPQAWGSWHFCCFRQQKEEDWDTQNAQAIHVGSWIAHSGFAFRCIHIRKERKRKQTGAEKRKITSIRLAPSGTSSNMHLAIWLWHRGLKLRGKT